jgi:hypothetical protein
MFTSRKMAYGLIVGVFTSTAVAAHASWDDLNPIKQTERALQTIAPHYPAPPQADLKIDPSKPLTPVTGTVTVPGVGSATVTPGPVPAPPVVDAEGNGVGATIINQANDIAQMPKNWIDQRGEEINREAIRMGNEIGMVWANFKKDLEKKGKEFATTAINWLKEQAEKYGIYALAGIGALFIVRGFFGWLLGGRRNSRTKFAGYHA